METSKTVVATSRFKIPPLVQHLLKFALGGAVIWAMVRSGALDPVLVTQAIVSHPWLCFFGLVTYLVPVVLAGWLRWYLILLNAGLKVSAWRCLTLQMIGLFFNTLIPGGNGGDVIKGYYLFQDHKDGEASLALTSIAMDRLVGTYGLLCMGMIMAGLNYSLWKDSTALRINSLFYACVFLLFTLAIAFFLSPYSSRFLEHQTLGKLPGGRIIKSFAKSLLIFRLRPKGLLLVLGIGFVVDAGLILMYILFARTLGLTIPWLVHGFVVPTMTMINGLPISPSGVGVGEAAGEMIYRNVGVLQGGSEIIALVHICILLASLLGGPFYFLKTRRF